MAYGPQQPTDPQAPPAGPWLGLIGLVLGILGVVVPFLPVALEHGRPLTAMVFGLAGMIVSALGLLGRRSGKPLAGIGVALSLLAALVGTIMIANYLF